ncbi:MAG: SRPBCC domain-containing protein [Pseudomonadota bacterium]
MKKVIVSSETVIIHATAERVWGILTDFERYGEWNSFCPSIEASLEIGSPVKMQVDLGAGLQEQVEYITEVDAPRRITWSMENRPGDPIHADRVQEVTAVDAGRCTYRTWDEFSGEAVDAMVEALGQQVEDGFNRCAQDLKRFAEA